MILPPLHASCTTNVSTPFSQIVRALRKRCGLFSCSICLVSQLQFSTAAENTSFDKKLFSIDAPAHTMDMRKGVFYAEEGFVIRLPKRPDLDESLPWSGFIRRGSTTVMGHALRWNQAEGLIFAIGNIVIQHEQYVIEAEQLGFRMNDGTGSMRNVRIAIQHPDHVGIIEAQKIEFSHTELVLNGVRTHAGHGAMSEISSKEIRIRLHEREEENSFREGSLAKIKNVKISQPLLKLAGIPSFWLPMVYRDYTHNYPWTRFRFGDAAHLGSWARGEIGVAAPLPNHGIFDAHFRGDYYDKAGTAYGIDSVWSWNRRQRGFGYGLNFKNEKIYDRDGNNLLETRDASVYDIGHRSAIGPVSIGLRYSRTPDADATGSSDEYDERFRADYFPEKLAELPLARRGIDIAYSNSWASFYATSYEAANENASTSNMPLQAQLYLGSIPLAPGIQLEGASRYERIETSDELLYSRQYHRADLSAMYWLGGFSLDASFRYDGQLFGELQNVGLEENSRQRWVPHLDAGARIRLSGKFGELQHSMTPRIALVYDGIGSGDEIPSLDAESFNAIDEDRQLIRTDFTTSLQHTQRQFRLDLRADWGLREEDRIYTENGVEKISTSSLVEGQIDMSGRPIKSLRLDADGRYNGLRSEFERWNLEAKYEVHRSSFTWRSTWIDDDEEGKWEYRPKAEIRGLRYSLDLELTLLDGGRDVDQYEMEIHRRFLDGFFTFGIARRYDEEGVLADDRITFTLSLDRLGAF